MESYFKNNFRVIKEYFETFSNYEIRYFCHSGDFRKYQKDAIGRMFITTSRSHYCSIWFRSGKYICGDLVNGKHNYTKNFGKVTLEYLINFFEGNNELCQK